MSAPTPPGTLGAAGAVLAKELRLERRAPQTLVAMALFSATAYVLFHFALRRDTVDGDLASGVLWVTLTLAALLGIGRLFVADRDEGGLDGFLLAPVDRSALFLAKTASLLLFLVARGVGVGGPWLYVGLGAAVAKGTVALMIHIDVARRGKAGDILAFQWFFDGTDEDLADRFDTDQFSVLGVGRAFGRRDLYLLVWGTACIVGIPELALGLAAAISGVYFGLGVAHVVAKSRSAA